MRKISFAICAAFIAGSPAFAQSDTREAVEEAIRTCETISVEAVRAACLEATKDLLTPDAPVPDPVTPEAPENSATSAELEQLARERAALAREREAFEQAQAEAAEENNSREETERKGILARLGLGASEDTDPVATTLTIERITVDKRKIHRFYTSEGDILVQEKGGLRLRLPSTLPATAKFERKILGSKWLSFDENPRRSYKVSVRRRD